MIDHHLTDYMLPPHGGLIFSTPEGIGYELAAATPATIGNDKDRAVLRAYLTLALERLDRQEKGLADGRHDETARTGHEVSGLRGGSCRGGSTL